MATATPAAKSADKPMSVVVKSLAVLTELGTAPRGLSLQDLHESLAIPLGSMHRILATLEHERFVSRSASTRRYVLGAAARSLATAGNYDSYLVQPPAAVLELGRVTGETVFLTQLVDDRIVCVALVESTHNLRLFVHVGQELPLHAAASARIILAYRDPRTVAAMLEAAPREEFTPGTPSDVSDLLARLDRVRASGFEVCDNELDDNVWAVAAPVFDALGRVQFGLTVAAARARLPHTDDRERVTAAVVRTARALSTDRGYSEPATFSTPTNRGTDVANAHR